MDNTGSSLNILVQLYRYNLDAAKDEEEKRRMKQRQTEIEHCLMINLSHEYVRSVHILLENSDDEEYYLSISQSSRKVSFYNLKRQATYKDFLEYAKQTFSNDQVVCIIHSDIYLNWNINMKIFDDFLPTNTIFGLTRHEPTNQYHTICSGDACGLPYSPGGSADTFIFRMPIPESLSLNSVNHFQNLYGGECVFLHEWYRAGAKVLNPCFQVITIHLHYGQVYFKTYDKLTTTRPYYPELEPCPSDTNSLVNRPVALYKPGSVWCFRCKAAPNIFCRWQNGGKDWTCIICEMYNEYDKQQGHPGRVPRIV
jgi:hypothetical protein